MQRKKYVPEEKSKVAIFFFLCYTENRTKKFEVYKMKKIFLLLLSFFVLSFFSYAKITLKSDFPSKITENSEI